MGLGAAAGTSCQGKAMTRLADRRTKQSTASHNAAQARVEDAPMRPILKLSDVIVSADDPRLANNPANNAHKPKRGRPIVRMDARAVKARARMAAKRAALTQDQ